MITNEGNNLMETTNFPKPISLVSILKLTASIIAVGISIFHLYTGAFGIIEAYGMRTIHLMTLLVLAFLYWPASKKWSAEKSAIIDIPLVFIYLKLSIISSYARIIKKIVVYWNGY